MSKLYRITIPLLLALLVLTIGASTAQANNSLTATATAAVNCSTTGGPGAAQNIVVKPAGTLTTGQSIAVTYDPPTGGLVVTAPGTPTLTSTNASTGLTYTVAGGPGCANMTNGSHPTVQFKVAGTADASTTVTETVTSTTSGLVAPTSVTLTCVQNSDHSYTPGSNVVANITSTATGGTPFTVDQTSMPGWLSVSGSGTAGTTAGNAVPVTFGFGSSSRCGALSAGSSTTPFTVHLVNQPAPDKTISVTLNVLNPSPINQPTAPALLQYVKGSGQPAHDTVKFAVNTPPTPYFYIDTTTLPIWLTVDATAGTATVAGANITFTTTSITDTLAVGTYSANVHVKVSGYGDLLVPFSLQINNQAPKFTVSGGLAQTVQWTIGTNLPTFSITVLSTDTPIPYSITTGGALQPQVASQYASGLAYSFGTMIPVTFGGTVFASAQPGDSLTGTVTFTYGNNSTAVVTLTVKVVGVNPSISGLSPGTIPTGTAGTHFSVVMSGANFVVSTDPTQMTRVGLVTSGSTITTDTNISYTVVNPSSILLTFTVPTTADTNIPFGNGGSITLGVCNPLGNATCSNANSTTTLYIGAGPVIQAVTSASTFMQASPGSYPNVAPYDMLSIFGANFCVSTVSNAVTGCSSSTVLTGSPQGGALQYPTALSPDASNAANPRNVQVLFFPHGQSGTAGSLIARGALLFATNNQINVLAPGILSTMTSTTVDVVVSFGYGNVGATTQLQSAAYAVNVVASNPGIFTIGSDGQGSGAILDHSWSLVSAANPAAMRNGSDSDTIHIYMTGLGAPDSAGANANGGGDCASITAFVSAINGAVAPSPGLTYPDGVVLSDAWLGTGDFVPCFATIPVSVKVNGQTASVSYAGWVTDAIAGLYQIDATLPAATVSNGQFTPAQPIPYSVQVTVGSQQGAPQSQTGVTMWVAPRLKVVAPTALIGAVGTAWDSTSADAVAASEGSSPGATFKYAVTSGTLPSGLGLNQDSGKITGMPGANTNGSYNITVTATDNAPTIPVTGSVNFTLTVNSGLIVNATAPSDGTYGTGHNLTTVSAIGGVGPYTYSITTSPLAAGITVGADGIVKSAAYTPAGTYPITVQVQDSNQTTSTIDVTVKVKLNMTNTAISGSFTVASGGNITVVTTTGNSGSIHYTLDGPSGTTGFVINDQGQLTIPTNSSATGPFTVTVTAQDSAPASGASGNASSTLNINVTLQ